MPLNSFYLMPHPPIIIPEIGKGEEKLAENTIKACEKIAKDIAFKKTKTIIIITPHGPVFSDAVAISYSNFIKGNLKNFNAPSLNFEFKINKDLTQSIIDLADKSNIPLAIITENSYKEYNIPFILDHGAIVPLYFIAKEYNEFSLVHITYGMISPIKLYEFGILIEKTCQNVGENIAIIASGDLSHKLKNSPYGYDKNGEVFDTLLLDCLKNGDVKSIFTMDNKLIKKASECGLRSIYILLGSLNNFNFQGNILSYEAPFGIGYANIKFDVISKCENKLEVIKHAIKEKITSIRMKEDPYVKLARESLEYYIKNNKYLKIPNYVTDEMLNQKRGVFVSIYKHGELRGCIGTIFPTTNSVAEEIIRNAVESGTNDPRFFPVEEDELDELEFSVDVLMPPEPAKINDLDPKKYGIIVRKGIRTGVLLPNLDGIDTVEKQLEIALKKANISPEENYSIERFEVIRHR
ncbi:uncharacterized protein, PH0010 family/AmmeMemoRadiSam system protein A/AmmeMemoRadiSam system protein B [Caloramator fervidus]|uniref:Uncharacterized protein, PH0010 family/AmmeMemoRadiSam system protein A/AmmeMemoRadiSam system protein B n=1 Tax=Caloramator fervidus TaxID=29344 RepID=A0A1H5TR08_9CLOT|nr:AmmeMemoRadiSam system protein A [Caloramator fervidus]SEF65190.1 uncharacterized protein, PH0010 family/AmmeMemoRadiSam system protein A/AmmeMemoRadiSam system protein B [Caloramator fervidus]